MIIKDKPFHVPCCQSMYCNYYFPAALVGVAFSACDSAAVRRWPGFVKLDAYQVRLSRFLVMRRADAVFDRGLDRYLQSSEWLSCVWSDFDDYLIHVGGVL